MAFYKAGAASVTNGNAKVLGAATLWTSGAKIGHLWIGPDGLPYEITNIASDTELTIDPPYRGATAAGQSYRIAPTQDEIAAAARTMAELIGSMAAVRDGIGQGLVPAAGTAAAPNLRFANDQDTGFRRVGENSLALVTGAFDRLTADTNGVVTVTRTADGQMTSQLTSQDAAWRLTTVNGIGGGAEGTTKARLALVFNGDVNNENAAIDFQRGGDGVQGAMAFRTTNAERLRITTAGNIGIGTTGPASRLHVSTSAATQITIENTSGTGDCATVFKVPGKQWNIGINVGGVGNGVLTFYDVTRGTAAMAVDSAGNLLVGVTTSGGYGGAHRIAKGVTQGSAVLGVDGQFFGQTALFYSVNASGYSAAGAAMMVGRNDSTGRSINAGGTINASGADYAEYMRKAGACGVLAKGQIVGIDAKGLLTDRFSLAHSFVIKSTDPAYVGGDNWSPGPPPAEPILALPPYKGPDKPTAPGAAPAAVAILREKPIEPVQQPGEELLDFIRRMARWIVEDGEWVKAMNDHPKEVEAHTLAETAHVAAEAKFKVDVPAWQKAMAAYAADVAAAEKAHTAATAKYKTDKAAWDVSMEAARQCVDRVAFSGQVPCNVAAGTFKPGDYIVGSKGKSDEIVGLIISNAVMRLNPGHRCDAVGKVWRVMEDGRAWVAVLIG